MKELATAKFDETVELAVRLGVDPRKADQIVRGTLSLPPGPGRDVRVAVFAAGEKAAEARSAGADVVGADDLVARVANEGFLDFDVAIATPDLMAQVGTPRPGPRPPWPHAQPEDRHRHDGRRQGGQRVQGRPGRVPDRQGGQHPRAGRQGLLHQAAAAGERPCRHRRARPGQAGRGQGPLPQVGHPRPRRWARASSIDPARAREVDEELGRPPDARLAVAAGPRTRCTGPSGRSDHTHATPQTSGAPRCRRGSSSPPDEAIRCRSRFPGPVDRRSTRGLDRSARTDPGHRGQRAMENPRPEKVAVVEEVRERLASAQRLGRHRVPRA